MESDREEDSSAVHNVESQNDTKDIEADLKSEAIGSTLYHKTFVFDTLTKMSQSKSKEKFRDIVSEEDEFLSDLDTLVGMSASEDVCDFLASPTSDCLPMLVAELLLPTPFGPVQQDPKSPSPDRSEEDEKEHGIDAKFISHCLRRQELTLVILSNVVLRKNVVLNRLCPQEEVASQYLIQLPFASSGFSRDDKSEYLRMLQEGSPHIQEYTSILSAFLLYLRNLLSTLTDLMTDGNHSDNESDESSKAEIDPKVQKLCGYMSAAISDPSVMDTMSLVLATSTNQELLEKCSKCLASLIEFAEDMDNCLPFFRQCATSQNLWRGIVEALGQSCKTRDFSTALAFTRVMGDILATSEITSDQLEFPDREDLMLEICDKCLDLIVVCSGQSDKKEVLKDCSTVAKLLCIIWTSLGCHHLPSFEALGRVLINSRAVAAGINDSSDEDKCKRGDDGGFDDDEDEVGDDLEVSALSQTISQSLKKFVEKFQHRNKEDKSELMTEIENLLYDEGNGSANAVQPK